MAVMVASAQSRLEDSLEIKQKQLSNLKQIMDKLADHSVHGLNGHTLSLLFVLGQVALFGPRKGLSLAQLAAVSQTTKQTVRKWLRDLEELGLVEKLSKRPLVVALSAKGVELLEIER